MGKKPANMEYADIYSVIFENGRHSYTKLEKKVDKTFNSLKEGISAEGLVLYHEEMSIMGGRFFRAWETRRNCCFEMAEGICVKIDSSAPYSRQNGSSGSVYMQIVYEQPEIAKKFADEVSRLEKLAEGLGMRASTKGYKRECA